MELNKVYQEDCADFCKRTDLKFNLILTDPPYNIGKDFGNDTDKLPLDVYLDKMHTVLTLCKDLLEDDGSIVWFCTHVYVGYIQKLMYDIGLKYRRMLIWYYLNGMSRQRRTPVTEYEPILWFSKSDDFTYNVDDMRIPYRSERVKNPCYKKDSKGVKRAWLPNPMGALKGDVWKYPVLSGKLYQQERTAHPTQKPETIVTDLIRAFLPKKVDAKVFDPFSGSGTVPVCCQKLGIKWVACEIEDKWVDVTNKRLETLRE